MSTRSAPSTPPVPRGVRRRARLLASAALTVVAALALTGCHDGQGLRDEGPSGASTVNGSAAAPPRGHAQPGGPARQRSLRAASVAQ
ncbi:hypothetical protein OG802_20305 [Streptomyces sp. NBC_00704]|uniref:hypothetical protein n=1 Tax=Streptomyces sp. NBC_00704 TaxID=2975809 RepID=UPI002E3538A3|nr:hypothetical protein [Streptomyces sp. NBC_00704]